MIPTPPEKYQPLQSFVVRAGGTRVAMHGAVRRRLVEMAVEEFPADAAADQIEPVLRARLRRRVRDQYGSVIGMILIGVLVELIVKAVIAWWQQHHSHQVLMLGWQRQYRAQANSNL